MNVGGTYPGIAVRMVPWAALVALLLLVGAGIGIGFGREVAIALLVSLAAALGMHRWRFSVYGLLAFLPVVGIFIVATHPDSDAALVSKDVLFLLPAYLGFLVYTLGRRSAFAVPGLPLGLIALFAALVVAQTANPAVPSYVAALIGTKVWIAYIPLLVLGYHVVRTERELTRFLTFVAAVAVLPAVIGIAEAIAIAAGAGEQVYRLYGDAAPAVTQNFAQFQYGDGGVLRRVPSTFSFVTQYYVFVSIMVALGYALWRSAETTRGRAAARGFWLLMLVAAFLSGARGAFILIPLLVWAIVALDGGIVRRRLAWLAPLAGLGAAASVIGTSGSEIVTRAIETGRADFVFTFVEGIRDAGDASWLGLGTGTVTNAARHAYGDGTSFVATHGILNESWYVKAQLELGVAGLVLLVAILGMTLTVALRRHRRLRSARLRAFSAAVIGLLLWSIAYAFKAQYVDLDPLNVYFWLLLGILARIWTLDGEAQGP